MYKRGGEIRLERIGVAEKNYNLWTTVDNFGDVHMSTVFFFAAGRRFNFAARERKIVHRFFTDECNCPQLSTDYSFPREGVVGFRKCPQLSTVHSFFLAGKLKFQRKRCSVAVLQFQNRLYKSQ